MFSQVAYIVPGIQDYTSIVVPVIHFQKCC